jgi:hypothetical protein
LDAAFPERVTASDGTIGDAAHASRSSDHNPWLQLAGIGVVTAIDITHDPAHGVDINQLSDALVASKDRRIKYVIANGLICDSRPGESPWTWRPFSGPDPHRQHLHLSVMPAHCDELAPWSLGIPHVIPTVTDGGLDNVALSDSVNLPQIDGNTQKEATVAQCLAWTLVQVSTLKRQHAEQAAALAKQAAIVADQAAAQATVLAELTVMIKALPLT